MNCSYHLKRIKMRMKRMMNPGGARKRGVSEGRLAVS
jgi:hypothetical protein